MTFSDADLLVAQAIERIEEGVDLPIGRGNGILERRPLALRLRGVKIGDKDPSRP